MFVGLCTKLNLTCVAFEVWDNINVFPKYLIKLCALKLNVVELEWSD